MPPSVGIPSAFRRRNLILDFASLKYACPEGVYVAITPGDPTSWSGVMFIRNGPYAPSVLRFQILFPHSYPDAPPLVIFSTDMFHPLITSLTTYTSVSADTVSVPDEERLPPGGFSLKHGFPQWFGRTQQSTNSSRNVSGSQAAESMEAQTPATSEQGESQPDGLLKRSPEGPSAVEELKPPSEITVAEILTYVQSTFTDESVLDSLSITTAANPGALHAWRTYRADKQGSSRLLSSPDPDSAQSRARGPGDWKWNGVWEERVRKGKDASTSEAVLFGNMPGLGDDMIRFLDLDTPTSEKLEQEVAAQVMASTN